MKIKKKVISVKLIFLLITCIGIQLSCLKTGTKETLLSEEWQYYSFDASSLIVQYTTNPDNLDSLLFPESENLVASSIFEQSNVIWAESDYQKAAEIVHQFEWGEGLNNWHLFDKSIYYDCSRIETGPVGVTVDYYVIRDDSRFVTYLDIQPAVNVIRTRHREYTPAASEWETIESTAIPGTMAMLVADIYGGREIQNRLNSECSIEIRYSSPSEVRSVPVWIISYIDNSTGLTALKIVVDAYTSEVLKE